MELKELVEVYGKHDNELKKLKTTCDKEKETIKEMMTEQDLDNESYGGFTVTKIIQKRESFDEDKAIEILKNGGINEVVKTKEYLDMNALENAMYNGKINKEIALQLDSCRSVKEVITLKCSKTKKKEEEE